MRWGSLRTELVRRPGHWNANKRASGLVAHGLRKSTSRLANGSLIGRGSHSPVSTDQWEGCPSRAKLRTNQRPSGLHSGDRLWEIVVPGEAAEPKSICPSWLPSTPANREVGMQHTSVSCLQVEHRQGDVPLRSRPDARHPGHPTPVRRPCRAAHSLHLKADSAGVKGLQPDVPIVEPGGSTKDIEGNGLAVR